MEKRGRWRDSSFNSKLETSEISKGESNLSSSQQLKTSDRKEDNVLVLNDIVGGEWRRKRRRRQRKEREKND